MRQVSRDKHLKRAIDALPEHAPDDSLWSSIEGELAPARESKPTFSTQLKWRLVATFVLLSIPIAALFYRSGNSSEKMSYSEEIAVNWESESTIDNAGFDNFLSMECDDLKPVCEGQDFKNLISQLEEVNREVFSVTEMIDQSGKDEFLLKAKMRLEKEETRIKRKIIMLLKG